MIAFPNNVKLKCVPGVLKVKFNSQLESNNETPRTAIEKVRYFPNPAKSSSFFSPTAHVKIVDSDWLIFFVMPFYTRQIGSRGIYVSDIFISVSISIGSHTNKDYLLKQMSSDFCGFELKGELFLSSSLIRPLSSSFFSTTAWIPGEGLKLGLFIRLLVRK